MTVYVEPEAIDAFWRYIEAQSQRADIRFVTVATDDGGITVAQCVGCGMLDPDHNPFHVGGCAHPASGDAGK